jgi:putative iron-regulated protein
MKILKLTALTAISFLISQESFANKSLNQRFKSDYAKLVYSNYSDALQDAKILQKKINNLLKNPTKESFAAAKTAWLVSRNSYGQTEAFRFYEGPIDFVNKEKGLEGPEGRLNSWPLDESYIDYVQGNETSGIVNDKKSEISKSALQKANQENDESQVSLGYHAIEFLLWGQDFSKTSAGNRPVSDYAKEHEKRRQYLSLTAEMLVDDLEFLVGEWKPNKFFGKNYSKEFVKSDVKEVQKNILSSLATLSAFELASERMATALDSGDQEDEHSCFSDNTHNDFIYNQQGIKNVFLGDYKDFNGVGIYELLVEKNQKLADTILAHIEQTSKLISEIPSPIDANVLATKKGSAGRAKMEESVKALQQQANLFLQAGKELGVDAKIISE